MRVDKAPHNPPAHVELLAHVNVIPAQAAKLGCESGNGSHPSVDRQSPFLRPCCTLVRPAGLFVPSRSRHSREAFTQGRLRPPFFFGAARGGLTVSSSLSFREKVGHPPILNPASAAMLTMSASVEPSETIWTGLS